MPKRKPLKIFNVKLSDDHHLFIARTAKAQGHTNKSEVIKRLINREMGLAK